MKFRPGHIVDRYWLNSLYYRLPMVLNPTMYLWINFAPIFYKPYRLTVTNEINLLCIRRLFLGSKYLACALVRGQEMLWQSSEWQICCMLYVTCLGWSRCCMKARMLKQMSMVKGTSLAWNCAESMTEKNIGSLTISKS